MDQVSKIVEALVEVIKSASSAVSAQLPDIAQQAVAWEIQYSETWLIVCAILAALCIVWFIASVCADAGAGAFGSFVGIVLFTCLATSNYLDMKRAEVAPKIFLLHYFSEQISSLSGCKK